MIVRCWFFMAVLLIVPALAADETMGGTEVPRNEVELKAKIEKEIVQLGEHAWAGTYYEGDGLGANITLTLAPESGFTYTWFGCLGLYGHNYGTVSEKDGQIVLTPVIPYKGDKLGEISTEYVPIPWGSRRYLVPQKSLEEFCNYINSGSEPRDTSHGFPFLRVGDENKKVTGLPSLPDAYNKYILEKPIFAKIVGVASPTIEPAIIPDFHFIKHNVIVDAGSTKGVYKGLEFHIVRPNRIYCSVRVTSVEADKSIGVYSYTSDEKDQGPPKTTWKLSTKP